MLPDSPSLVKCWSCNKLLWIEEQLKVGSIDLWDSNSEDKEIFAEARSALVPTLQDYVDFLEEGITKKNKEHYVRLRVWWAGNDHRRQSCQSLPLSSFEIQNLRAYASMLDESEESERVMKAEVFRELGEFEEAERFLAAEFNEDLEFAASIIRDLNQKRIATVSEIIFS